MSETIISLSSFKTDASRMLKEMRKTGRRVVLTQNGAATAVVQDIEDYQRDQQALLMMKLMVQGEADVRNRDLSSQGKVFSSLRRKLERAVD